MTNCSRCSVALIVACMIAVWQAAGTAARGQVLNQDQEMQVHDLPSLMARSHDPSDVLLTSLDTVIHDREVCCGKDSALEDSAQAADPKSLKDIAAKLDGRHLLSDGRPIHVTAQFVAPDSVGAGQVVSMIVNQHAPLIVWNSNLYVAYGVVFVWNTDQSGQTSMYLHKLLLWDTRFSDSRRTVVYDRTTDDPAKVQGLLFLQADRQQ